MELAEIIGLRPRPGAGVLVTLTRRCPLSCAHCSTSSTMAGEEPDAAELLRFVESFAAADRPEVMMLTGGEPLLLPGLVEQLAVAARRAGTRSAVLTGAFFARAGRGGRPPRRIMDAVEAVDHFSVSLDAFHEREVSRTDVFALLRRVLDAGVPVSVHAVGSGPDDPYLADLAAQIRRVFAARVPMLVNTVRAVGRAASWAAARAQAADPREPRPCSMAAWPAVAFDGTVVACCNQETVDRRPVPGHLRLGHVSVDAWPDIRARALGSPALRMIRTVGPAYLRPRPAGTDHGYCQGCRLLGGDPAPARAVPGPAWGLLDRYVADTQVEAGPVAVIRRHGCAAYAESVSP